MPGSLESKAQGRSMGTDMHSTIGEWVEKAKDILTKPIGYGELQTNRPGNMNQQTLLGERPPKKEKKTSLTSE